MPRDGALTLSDVRQPTLSIVCEPCGRRGAYKMARLMEQHGYAKLTDLLQTLANCPKARSASIHDRCKAVFEGSPYSCLQPLRRERRESAKDWPGKAGAGRWSGRLPNGVSLRIARGGRPVRDARRARARRFFSIPIRCTRSKQPSRKSTIKPVSQTPDSQRIT